MELISRQAAIKKILGQPPEPHYPSWYAEQIKELPPAEPKMGKWIYKNDLITVPGGYWECSECKEGRLLYEANFCPNCGAKMEVTE